MPAAEVGLPSHVSVVVVGADLSGIGAAYRLRTGARSHRDQAPMH